MFCPSCGAETKEGLRYCNRCGANLISEKTAPPRLFTLIVILSVVVLTAIIIGFLMVLFFGSELVSRGNAESIAFVFLSIFSLVVLGVIWLIVRQLARLIGIYLETGEIKKKNKSLSTTLTVENKPQFSESQTAQNLPPASTIPIDAEQLTRKFEKDTQ